MPSLLCHCDKHEIRRYSVQPHCSCTSFPVHNSVVPLFYFCLNTIKMVCIKEVQVTLQTHSKNGWRVCEEFESLETLESSANSATRRTTLVECGEYQFRFIITLTPDFKWLGKADALKISLTFDEGDPIRDYEVVVLKPAADGNDVQELGLESFKSNDTGESSYCLEAICMPLTVEDPSSPWLKAGFEFGRYSKGTY